jgi:hypothetical protein
VRRGLGAIVAATVAACATSGTPRSTRPSIGEPLFPPAAVDARPHERAAATPISWSAHGSSEDGAPVPAHRDLLATCAHDVNAGKALCVALTGGDDADCVKVCLDAYAEAHPKPPAPAPPSPPHPHALGVASSAPPPPSPPPPDPFASVLHDCILRVRDSGGSEPTVCHFEPPLDEMGFGQSHCDAKCAALTEAYRESPSRRLDGGSD